MATAKKVETLIKTDFPLYSIRMIDDKRFIVAGGGGQAKTGISNVFEIYELSLQDCGCVAKRVLRYDTGTQAVMNLAVHKGIQDITVATGQDDQCQLYKLRYKITSMESNNKDHKVDSVRNRKESSNKPSKNSSKYVTFDVEKMARTQTDFLNGGGFQKAVAISADCSIVATGGADGFLRVWKTSNMEMLYEVKAHKSDIDDIDISPLGNRIITASRDNRAVVWNTKDGKEVIELDWKQKTDIKYRVRNCRYGIVVDKKEEYRLYTSHIPSTRSRKPDACYLTKWDAVSNKPLKIVSTGTEILSALAVSDEGIYVGVGTISGSVSIYISFSLQKLYHIREAHNIFVTGLEFVNSSSVAKTVTGISDFTLFSISADNHVKIHQVAPRGMWSILWAIAAFLIIIYLAFWLMAALGV